MKKIGIVTFHRAKNYGANLQAFALQHTLSEKYDVDIIDYRCEYIEKAYYKDSLFDGINIKEIAKWVLRFGHKFQLLLKNCRFGKFQNRYYKLSNTCNEEDIKKMNADYDFFVSGSDQIWNTKWSNCDWNYFLDFADENKKYSYAASIGELISEKDKILIKDKLNSYNELVVRERKGSLLLKNLGVNKEIKTACDPTFFLSKQDWISIFKLKKTNKKYLLIYFVAKAEFSLEYAKKIAKECHLDIIYLNPIGTRIKDKDFVNVCSAGPIQFLKYIYNSDTIVTTSFHGVVFSLIFNKPFCYELCNDNGNDNSRIENLEEIFDISKYRITDDKSKITQDYNWDEINKRINKYSEDSKKVLNDMF